MHKFYQMLLALFRRFVHMQTGKCLRARLGNLAINAQFNKRGLASLQTVSSRFKHFVDSFLSIFKAHLDLLMDKPH